LEQKSNIARFKLPLFAQRKWKICPVINLKSVLQYLEQIQNE
jgi:hypothetical protein